MLASGGRVVRVEDNDPCAVNRLMAPTASELKTILYDQVLIPWATCLVRMFFTAFVDLHRAHITM